MKRIASKGLRLKRAKEELVRLLDAWEKAPNHRDYLHKLAANIAYWRGVVKTLEEVKR